MDDETYWLATMACFWPVSVLAIYGTFVMLGPFYETPEVVNIINILGECLNYLTVIFLGYILFKMAIVIVIGLEEIYLKYRRKPSA